MIHGKHIVFTLWLCLMTAQMSAVRSAVVESSPSRLTLENKFVHADWSFDGSNCFALTAFKDMTHGAVLTSAMPVFTLILGDGTVLSADNLKPQGTPAMIDLAASPAVSVQSERLTGRAIEVRYACPEKKLRLSWRAILRKNSSYIRQELVLLPETNNIVIRKLTLIAMTLPGAKVAGAVRGSPITTDTLFLGIEHPVATSTQSGDRIECSYSRSVALPVGQPFAISTVIGGAEKGQLRRAFNQYLERERAHPYRQFLHYNSWFHLNIGRSGNRMTEAEAIKAVEDIGTELTAKRGVVLQSYVMDDGWDSHEKVWDFHDQFPQGFANVARIAGRYHSGIGLWMSPFGGYGPEKNARLTNGKKVGFEINAAGFSMAGRNYQTHFLNTCLRMIRDYHVNFFKFDGMGGGIFADGGDSAYANDMDAIFNVIVTTIRKVQPDTYISATVGTWPSPFWLRFADSIWRQGDDTSFAGVGNSRERWITYRDTTVYSRIVKRGPLYPLNALMVHGLVVGERSNPAKMDRDELSVRHEARSFFGSGTSLQELYISPHLLTPAMWDDIAAAAKWAKRNEDSLADVHWVGGDPGKLEVYGYASWIPGKGTLTLRNPSDKSQTYRLDIAEAFELPKNAASSWRLQSPYHDQAIQQLRVTAGKPQEIILQPFDVVVYNATD